MMTGSAADFRLSARTGSWAAWLTVILGSTVAAVAHGQQPWRDIDPPPPAGQLALGASLATLDTLLGTPCSRKWPRNGRESRFYQGRGISIIADSTGGLAWVLFFTPKAGPIAGLRVGDTREAVIQRLGKPTRSTGDIYLYAAKEWALEVQLDPTGELVGRIVLGRTEFFPAAEFGVWATLKHLAYDLYAAGDAVGLFGLITVTNFLLWRRYKYWVPRYVHLLALSALLTIAWLNWLWVSAGGVLTVRRVLLALTFPAIVYFFFIGMGGIKAARAGSRAAN